MTIGICSLGVAACSGPFSTLDPAASASRQVAFLWWAMLIGATLVTVAVVALWLIALRRPPPQYSTAEAAVIDRRWLIGGGLILPTVTVALLLIWGIPIGHRMLPLPLKEGEALVVEVTAHQWWWQVRYPGTAIELRDRVVIPAGTPIDFHLTTADVIHSFWVPRLGGKLDTIPGRTNVLRLQADAPGEYRGQCAEFCGLYHAHMQFVVQALPEEEFAAWVAQAEVLAGGADLGEMNPGDVNPGDTHD